MEYTPRRALIVIDVQNDYIHGNLPIEYPDAETSLSNICKAMDTAKSASIPVVVVQTILPAGAPFMADGTYGAELHEVVRSRDRDRLVQKKFPSAFAGTGLKEWLDKNRIDTIAVIGYMTHNCDLSTLVDAVQAGFSVEFLSDASGSVAYRNKAGGASAEEIHRACCVVFQSRFAAVMSTGEWMYAVQTGTAPERDTIYGSHQRACSDRLYSTTPRPEKGERAKDRTGIRLTPITPANAGEIKKWPAYTGGFEQMDYALRENGWIDEFQNKAGSSIYAAKANGKLIGFSLLGKTSDDEAEFRIAVHPLRVGQGLGGKIAVQTLEKGFKELGLKRITLIVRKNNHRASRLYERLGFSRTGESVHVVRGEEIEFIDMEIGREKFYLKAANKAL